MKYELLVQVDGNWEHVDLGDDAPALVFQINDLNQLTDRQASYSQAIKIPKTPHNCRILRFADIFEAQSITPYRIIPCGLYYSGLALMSGSYRLEIRAVADKYFNCQIASNAKDFFEALGDKGFDDLPTFSTARWWNVSGINNSQKHPLEFAASAVTYIQPFGFQFIEHLDASGQFSYWAQEIFPYYNLTSLVREIINQAGYTFQSDVESMPGYKPISFSFPDLNPSDDTFDLLARDQTVSALDKTSSTPLRYPMSNELNMHGGTGFLFSEWALETIPDPTGTEPQLYTLRYTSPGIMNVRFKLRLEGPSNASAHMRYTVRQYQTTSEYSPIGEDRDFQFMIKETTYEEEAQNFINVDWYTEPIALQAGERVYIQAYLLYGNAGRYYFNVATEIDGAENKACAGSIVRGSTMCPFKNQLEALRLYMQLYGLFVEIDSERKVVELHSYNYLYQNVTSGKFVDWSDKIDTDSSRSTTFKRDSYAQENRFIFQPNENPEINFQDIGILSVDNKNLAETKDQITFSNESAHNYNIPIQGGTFLGETSLRLKENGRGMFVRVTPDDIEYYGGFGYFTLNDTKIHLVYIEDLPQTCPVDYLTNVGGAPALKKSARAVKMAEIMDTYYSPLKTILNPSRVIEAYFDLTEMDIANLDLLIPVYIDSYGDYFYIQKVQNYIVGELTRCTLVCLNIASRE